MSSQDEIARIDKALESKIPTSNACPVCRNGQFDVLRAHFTVRPSASVQPFEPIEAIGLVCVHCGFLSMHASRYLLDESL